MARLTDQMTPVRMSIAKRALLLATAARGVATGARFALPADDAEAGVWCQVPPGPCVYVEK